MEEDKGSVHFVPDLSRYFKNNDKQFTSHNTEKQTLLYNLKITMTAN